MARQYRSAMGKIVDFEKLRQANEKVIAVTGGSQNVNARGDELGENGRIIRTREEVVSEYNKRRNLNAVPDIQPDAIQIVPETQTNTGNPFDLVEDASRTDKFAIMDDEFGPMVSVREQKEAQEMERQRQADILKATTEMRKKRAAQVAAEGSVENQKIIKVDVGDLPPEEAIAFVKKDLNNTYIDDVTGKQYKTAAALKAAITKRENADDKEDASDAAWAE